MYRNIDKKIMNLFTKGLITGALIASMGSTAKAATASGELSSIINLSIAAASGLVTLRDNDLVGLKSGYGNYTASASGSTASAGSLEDGFIFTSSASTSATALYPPSSLGHASLTLDPLAQDFFLFDAVGSDAQISLDYILRADFAVASLPPYEDALFQFDVSIVYAIADQLTGAVLSSGDVFDEARTYGPNDSGSSQIEPTVPLVYHVLRDQSFYLRYARYQLNAKAVAGVPAPLPIAGAAAALGYSRKLRKRIKSSQTPEIMSAIG